MSTKKEIFEANEGLVIGTLIHEQINIEVTRVIGLKLKSENICIDTNCEKVELAFYQNDSWTECDLMLKADCKKCYGTRDSDLICVNPIFEDKSLASYEEMEVIAEIGLTKAVQKHFKEYHLEFYQKLLEAWEE